MACLIADLARYVYAVDVSQALYHSEWLLRGRHLDFKMKATFSRGSCSMEDLRAKLYVAMLSNFDAHPLRAGGK